MANQRRAAKQPVSQTVATGAGSAPYYVRHVVHFNTVSKIYCEHCHFGDTWPRVTFAEAINHYIEEHGYRLLYIGSETYVYDTPRDGPGVMTVAVLGHESPPPPKKPFRSEDLCGEIPFESIEEKPT